MKFIEKIKPYLKNRMVVTALIVACAFVILLLLSLLIRLFTQSDGESQVAKKLQHQTGSQISTNVQYTTRETLSTLTGEADNLEHGLAKVNTQVDSIKMAMDQSNKNLKASLDKAIEEINKKNADEQAKLHDEINEAIQTSKTSKNSNDTYPVNDQSDEGNTNLIWIHDQANTTPSPENHKTGQHFTPILSQDPNVSSKKDTIPAYTIPANTILANVIPEQPLIGVIPTDGTVMNPESVLFMVGSKNLAANNWRLPMALKGIQGNALCQGVFNFNHSAVRCDILSLTFIFRDGTISTATTTKDKPFGQLTDHYGNPYIEGAYHGNALLGAVGTGAFYGMQGFGNAFSASQVQTQVGYPGSYITTFKNANDFALGQGVGKSGEALNNWWLSIMRSTTNYVFVPNWSRKYGGALILNAKITEPVHIDYDPNARRVQYDVTKMHAYSTSLD